MEIDDYADFDSTELESWHWYVLIGYPALSLLGIVMLGQFTDGGSVLASSLGSVALLIVLSAFGLVSLPAINRDTAFVRAESEEWDPDPRTYVGAAVAIPLSLGLLGGVAAGFGLALALLILTFLVTTVGVCVVYLYNRHQTIGLLSR